VSPLYVAPFDQGRYVTLAPFAYAAVQNYRNAVVV
jgi:hypothetical protein